MIKCVKISTAPSSILVYTEAHHGLQPNPTSNTLYRSQLQWPFRGLPGHPHNLEKQFHVYAEHDFNPGHGLAGDNRRTLNMTSVAFLQIED